ncbi:glutaredoxin family protein [Ferrimicrobium acidiphilum]|uniref:glutaredoxin family protein n=1 Tax=Ferrimicrobium acidiphilum TaxID=121039 RepID=UPI0023F187F8|nr:glutaredoxin family protein [Ferrimicrobium acidiphilum]
MEVVIVTQTDCHFCEMATEILDRLRAEFGLKIHHIDLAGEDGKLIVQKFGLLFPPGILIGDELVSYGRPSERKLRREFAKRLGRTTK